MHRPAVSVVVPVYNEAPNVRAQVAEIIQALEGCAGGFEILLVDDGSTDSTAEEVLKLSKEDERIRLISMGRNQGQAAAMGEGFRQAGGETIVTIDGDCQHDARDIPALVAGVKAGADVVCGYRRRRRDSYLNKVLPSRIFNALLRLLFKVPIHDSSCTLRAYRPAAVLSLNLYPAALSFIPILCARAGYDVREMTIRHRARVRGKSKYDSPLRFFSTFAEMLRIRLGKCDDRLPPAKRPN